MRLRLLTVLVLGCTLAGCGGGAVEKDNPVEPELADRFRIRDVPVEVSEAEGRTRKGVEVVPVEFPSTGGDRVTGYLARPVVPADDPAGVILLHGLRGGADDFLNEARELARRGAVALTIDSPYVRSDDEKLREGRADLQPTYRAMELWVEDVLRGLDLLVERYGADPSRLGLVG
jgi:cephalosporin-C deacetylase-like acetyl esterase